MTLAGLRCYRVGVWFRGMTWAPVIAAATRDDAKHRAREVIDMGRDYGLVREPAVVRWVEFLHPARAHRGEMGLAFAQWIEGQRQVA